jgi:hypothetical protein
VTQILILPGLRTETAGRELFSEIRCFLLANRKTQAIFTNVPPFDDFGDWATPKKPAAELFYTLSSLPYSLFE